MGSLLTAFPGAVASLLPRSQGVGWGVRETVVLSLSVVVVSQIDERAEEEVKLESEEEVAWGGSEGVLADDVPKA